MHENIESYMVFFLDNQKIISLTSGRFFKDKSVLIDRETLCELASKNTTAA